MARIGIDRGGHVITALSGGVRAALTAAVANACVSEANGALTILVPEDRALDEAALEESLRVLAGGRGLEHRAPAYFRSLAETASPEDFAHEVDRAIEDFSDYERPRHLTAARHEASAKQEAALRALLAAVAKHSAG